MPRHLFAESETSLPKSRTRPDGFVNPIIIRSFLGESSADMLIRREINEGNIPPIETMNMNRKAARWMRSRLAVRQFRIEFREQIVAMNSCFPFLLESTGIRQTFASAPFVKDHVCLLRFRIGAVRLALEGSSSHSIESVDEFKSVTRARYGTHSALHRDRVERIPSATTDKNSRSPCRDRE